MVKRTVKISKSEMTTFHNTVVTPNTLSTANNNSPEEDSSSSDTIPGSADIMSEKSKGKRPVPSSFEDDESLITPSPQKRIRGEQDSPAWSNPNSSEFSNASSTEEITTSPTTPTPTSRAQKRVQAQEPSTPVSTTVALMRPPTSAQAAAADIRRKWWYVPQGNPDKEIKPGLPTMVLGSDWILNIMDQVRSGELRIAMKSCPIPPLTVLSGFYPEDGEGSSDVVRIGEASSPPLNPDDPNLEDWGVLAVKIPIVMRGWYHLSSAQGTVWAGDTKEKYTYNVSTKLDPEIEDQLIQIMEYCAPSARFGVREKIESTIRRGDSGMFSITLPTTDISTDFPSNEPFPWLYDGHDYAQDEAYEPSKINPAEFRERTQCIAEILIKTYGNTTKANSGNFGWNFRLQKLWHMGQAPAEKHVPPKNLRPRNVTPKKIQRSQNTRNRFFGHPEVGQSNTSAEAGKAVGRSGANVQESGNKDK